MSDDTHADGACGALRRPRGALESEVLAALWAADSPLSATQVREALSGDLAYTTVMTILARLHDKGLVARHARGRGYAYEPTRDEAAHTAEQMRSLLERGSDRQATLARFVSELSRQDEEFLQRLLTGQQEP